MTINKVAYGLIILIGSIAILVIGKSFLIPLILSVLIWFLIKEIRNIAQKTPFIGAKIPKWLLSVLSTLLLFVALGILSNILIDNLNKLSYKLGTYEKNLVSINNYVLDKYNVNFLNIWHNNIGEVDFTELLTNTIKSLTDILGNAFMIALYVLFLLFEESSFLPKIDALNAITKSQTDTESILAKIDKSISKYITLKTVVSLITGVASYIALVIIGIDTPIFWAFLIFVLNFIPTIGSLVATIFPATIALLQFGSFTPFFITLGIIGAIQVIVGNILEPKIMGNSLNVSSLVVILALSFWGMIWGVTGMVLSVPITVIMVILFSQFQTTKPLAVLLSEKGKI